MRLICGLHHGFIAGFTAFWWCSRHVIASLHNIPMATGENGCFCVKQTQHFSTFCWDICDFSATKMWGLWYHASGNRQFMRGKLGVFEKLRPLHKYAAFGWLCIELCDRIHLEGLVSGPTPSSITCWSAAVVQQYNERDESESEVLGWVDHRTLPRQILFSDLFFLHDWHSVTHIVDLSLWNVRLVSTVCRKVTCHHFILCLCL